MAGEVGATRPILEALSHPAQASLMYFHVRKEDPGLNPVFLSWSSHLIQKVERELLPLDKRRSMNEGNSW